MPRIFFLFITLLFFSNFLIAQMIGGTSPGDPSPRAVNAGAINEGTVSSSVNNFTGTLDLSQTLGTVSTVGGPSFTLTMSYSSSLMSGGVQQDMKGAPFGDGWSLNIPRISVSVEDFEKYNECQRGYFNSPDNANNNRGNMFFDFDDVKVEGDLYWFDPSYSIPGIGNGRLVYKYSRGGVHYFAPQEFESPVEFKLVQYSQSWEVTAANGDKYIFSAYPTYRNAPNMRVHPTSYGGGNPISAYNIDYDDILTPKVEIAEWVCKSISNSMSPERITFKYQFYGDLINMYQQFDQDCFEETNEYLPPPMYQGYILEQISSTLDILQLEYGNLFDDPSVNCVEEDLFFCKELVYDSDIFCGSGSGVDPNCGSGDWKRFKHIASLDPTGLLGTDGFFNSSDPYWSIQNGYSVDNAGALGPSIPFDHGWLESPRLPSNLFEEG
ncbi:MAG: hypothetical protein AAFN65_05965, partial [Bacteroidota bacterium]